MELVTGSLYPEVYSLLGCIMMLWLLEKVHVDGEYIFLNYSDLKVISLLWHSFWWFSHKVVSDSYDPMDYSPPGSSVHGISPGKNIGMGCHFLLQRIFPNQGSNPSLLNWQADSLPLSYHISKVNRSHIIISLLFDSFTLIITKDRNAFTLQCLWSFCVGCYIGLVWLKLSPKGICSFRIQMLEDGATWMSIGWENPMIPGTTNLQCRKLHELWMEMKVRLHSPITQAGNQRKAFVLEMPVLGCLLLQMGKGPPGDSQLLHGPVRGGEFENNWCLMVYPAGWRGGVACWCPQIFVLLNAEKEPETFKEVNCSQTNSMMPATKNSLTITGARLS